MKLKQRGEFDMAFIFKVAVVVGLLFWGNYYGRLYYVKRKVDKIMIQALNEWKETGLNNRPGEVLEREFEAQKIPEYVTKDSCSTRIDGKFRRLTCEWMVPVKAPILGEKMMTFKGYKFINADGILEDIE